MTTTVQRDHAPVTITAQFFDSADSDQTGRTEITWSTSDSNIVSISGSGSTVTATFNSVGTATITATQEGVTATADFDVTEIPVVILPIVRGVLTVGGV